MILRWEEFQNALIPPVCQPVTARSSFTHICKDVRWYHWTAVLTSVYKKYTERIIFFRIIIIDIFCFLSLNSCYTFGRHNRSIYYIIIFFFSFFETFERTQNVNVDACIHRNNNEHLFFESSALFGANEFNADWKQKNIQSLKNRSCNVTLECKYVKCSTWWMSENYDRIIGIEKDNHHHHRLTFFLEFKK